MVGSRCEFTHCELIGDSSASGKWLSADAIRIGGGTGDVTILTQTDVLRWEESVFVYPV